MNKTRISKTLTCLLAVSACASALAAPPPPREIEFKNGKLEYIPDDKGNRILDYSYAGYKSGGVAIPDAPVKVTVPMASDTEADATPRIQAAIDYVSSLPLDGNGIRGAVLLGKGRFPIATALHIRASGVVLRGQGQGDDGTVLVARGVDRRTLIQINGVFNEQPAEAHAITDKYVPVNAMTVHVANASTLHANDAIEIRRPSTEAWINYIGTFQNAGRPNSGDYRSWKPGKFDLFWHRVIAKVDGDAVTLDAPLTSTLDKQYTAAILSAYRWPGILSNVGIENLRCDSVYDAKNPLDEEHSWIAIGMESVQDSWVRQVTSRHFASSCVSILETGKRITVEDCVSLDPVSENAGYRRHSFYTAGQQTLFLRCHSEKGRHDYSAGYEATGPSAFVQCDADGSLDFSGTIESWSSGFLFDSMEIRDNAIKIDDLAGWNQGAGWSGVNCMIWNCQAPVITLRTPPGEKNWAFGVWAQYDGAGPWGLTQEWEKPDSLYMEQLLERKNRNAVAAMLKTTIPIAAGDAKTVDQLAADAVERLTHPTPPTLHKLAATNGWLTIDDRIFGGSIGATAWWNGHIDPQRQNDFQPAITRFTPGRTGQGDTDDLDQLTSQMAARGEVGFEHNWGLWYDERRQDHQQARRIDASVEPPFFEQAWARSGEGVAWNGLSKFDLTKFNPWYFGRLRQFADLSEQKGLFLVNQMYFQHHLLEDYAHWVDTPWRVTNALQDIGLPEPPPIIDRKRIIVANIYYDVTQPKLADFHRTFIRHELDNFVGQPNVIFTTGEEFNGPTSFVAFWLDTIGEWEKETGNHPTIALCCTKDVQDAILEDPARAKVVDVIFMKDWWYTGNGGLYNPPGGTQEALRKQNEAWKGPKGYGDIVQQIRDYRSKYPTKAIMLAYGAGNDNWGAVMAGASVIRLQADPKVLTTIPKMLPYEGKEISAGQLALAEAGKNYMVYARGGRGPIKIDLTGFPGTFAANWINANGSLQAAAEVSGGAMVSMDASAGSLLWLSKK